MLWTLLVISSMTAAASGFYVLSLGEFHKLKLKFAAVVLSTISSLWFAIELSMSYPQDHYINGYELHAYLLYSIARNISFILFHAAIGRDAMALRIGDRRKYPLVRKKAA